MTDRKVPAGNNIDLTEFFKLSRPKQKPCAIIHAREVIEDTEREQLQAAFLADKNVITNAAIRDWLARRDFVVSDAAISAHRRGVCSCVRDA